MKKTLDFIIIAEWFRTKLLNETIELNEEQKEIIENMVDKVYLQFNSEELSDIEDMREYVENVLKKYNLSFTDKRCYTYLYDAIFYKMMYC